MSEEHQKPLGVEDVRRGLFEHLALLGVPGGTGGGDEQSFLSVEAVDLCPVCSIPTNKKNRRKTPREWKA